MGWSTSASTGLFLIDFLFKRIFSILLKWPLLGMTVLLLWYGFVAYHVLKSVHEGE